MEDSEEIQVGKVIHYFPKIGVAIVEVTEASIKIGDAIHFKGAATDFWQRADSMQIDYEKIELADKGQKAGLKVDRNVRQNDLVYKRILI